MPIFSRAILRLQKLKCCVMYKVWQLARFLIKDRPNFSRWQNPDLRIDLGTISKFYWNYFSFSKIFLQLFFCRTWKNVLSNGTLCIHILQNYISKRLQYFFPKLSILFTWWYKSILYNCHWPKSITWLEFFFMLFSRFRMIHYIVMYILHT